MDVFRENPGPKNRFLQANLLRNEEDDDDGDLFEEEEQQQKQLIVCCVQMGFSQFA